MPESNELSQIEEVQEMQARLDLFQSVLDASAEGLSFISPDGILLYVNQSFEAIHGVRASEVIGRHVTDVIKNTRMDIVAKTQLPEETEFLIDGSRRYVVSRIPVYRKGRMIGVLGKIDFPDLDKVKELANRIERLEAQLKYYRNHPRHGPGPRYTAEDIVAVSPRSAEAKATAMRVAPTHSTVLLLGESGVGKEVYAHAIHSLSLRAPGPFVRVNCSAIVESLFESELFGYEEGAFTGAKKGGNPGKFEMANLGTIFLDEIADMPLQAQAKLLRVLQEQEIEKLGAGQQIKVDVRIVAATNQDLSKLVAEGRFRKDLFFRINVIPITIPPIRERREDIPALVATFWEELANKHGISYKKLRDDALDLMCNYDWPGNVREMRNIIERALVVIREGTITPEHLRILILGGAPAEDDTAVENCDLAAMVAAVERRSIATALARANNNRAQAAKLLGISRPLLYKKLHAYGIG
jgi:PAS domain S-box-containing protein